MLESYSTHRFLSAPDATTTTDTPRTSFDTLGLIEEKSRSDSFERKTQRMLELTTNVAYLEAERKELRGKLSEVEKDLAEAVQLLQQERYANDNIEFDSPKAADIPPRKSLPRPSTSSSSDNMNVQPKHSRSNSPAPSNRKLSQPNPNHNKNIENDDDDETKEENVTKSFDSRMESTDESIQKQVYKELDAASDVSDQDDTVGPLNARLMNRKVNSGMSEASDYSMADPHTRGTFASIRPKTLERNFSFSVDGMTELEVQEHMVAMTPGHARTAEEVEKNIVTIRTNPTLLEEPLEETFFELFYDLILVVVFIKLSYLKYELTGMGLLTVAAGFSNFWSCWSLMNCYVTMLHTEDMLHRAYYVAHITASFMLAITIDHPSYDFFSYQTMAQYHAAASVLCRCITLVMWAYAYHTNLESSREEESLYIYTHRHITRQIGVHFFTIFISTMIFVFTMIIPWHFVKETDEDKMSDTLLTACLWILAVVIEQFGSSIGAVYMKLPFPAIYAGSRMQAWLMLCFGESVIGLLIEPIFYQASQLGSLISAFFMILALCTVYFDIVDADNFLHLFMTRKEKFKAFAFMNFQLPFSFSIFLGGVALKNIMFISSAVFELEADYDCNHHSANAGGSSYGYGSSYGSAYSSSYGGSTSYSYGSSRRQLSVVEKEEVIWPARMLGASGGSGFTVLELDTLLFKSFQLLTFSFSGAMVSSILIGYAMPIELPDKQVHLSRIGAVLTSLMTLIVPYNLKSIATPCLGTGDDADDYEGYDEGLSLMKALVTTSFIMIFSFSVALGSLDPNREETYHKLEVEAHYELTKKALKHRVAKRNVFMDLFETAVTGITDITDTIADNFADITETIAEHIPVFRHAENTTPNNDDGETKERPSVVRKRRSSVRKQERQAKKDDKAKLDDKAKTEYHAREKKTVPQNIGRLGQATEASKHRNKTTTVSVVEQQARNEKNARKSASTTLTNAKLEYQSRDKVTKTQDIGSLGKLTEATKNRKSAATVENVGSTEMQTRNQNKSRVQTSQALTDAKTEWEKRRKVTKPQDIGRLGQATEASRNGRYIEPTKTSSLNQHDEELPIKSPAVGRRSKSPASRNSKVPAPNSTGIKSPNNSKRNKSPSPRPNGVVSSRSKSRPEKASPHSIVKHRSISLNEGVKDKKEDKANPITSMSLDDTITSNNTEGATEPKGSPPPPSAMVYESNSPKKRTPKEPTTPSDESPESVEVSLDDE